MMLVETSAPGTPKSVTFPMYPDANGNITDYLQFQVSNFTFQVFTVAHYEYSPFGQVTFQSGDLADSFTYKFSSKYWDGETGLGYWGRRYYHPDLGRWISRDPIEESGGVMLYGYCGNEPVGRIDVLGMATEEGEKLTIHYTEPKMPKPTPLDAGYLIWNAMGDNQGHTTYTPRSFRVYCIGCRAHCSMSLTPKIYLLNTLDKLAKWNADILSWKGALGHEQHHVRAVMSNVNAIYDDLADRQGRFDKSSDCTTAAKAYEKEYKQKFMDATDQTKDRHGQNGHPDAGMPYKPEDD